jgi:flagellar M-ring protein FliF
MSDKFSGALGRGKQLLAGFTTGQKVMTLLALVALIGGGLAFSSWASKPTYAPLYSNLPGADASAVVDKLTAGGTPYQLTDGGGTILVPKDKVYSSRLEMSGQGLPAAEATGYALLDKEGLTASDFRQHVAFRRALEGELSKTIQSFEGINTAVVHLAIPQKDVFDDDKKTATASVLVDMRPGKELNPQQVQAIVHLVAHSVEGLPAEQVTVADSSGKVLSISGESGVLDAAGDARAQQKQAEETRLSKLAQNMIEPVVGAGHARIVVNAKLNFDQRNTTSERYTQPEGAPTLADSTATETFTGAGNPTGGVLGPNTPAAANNQNANNNYRKQNQTRNNAVDRTVEQVKNAPGGTEKLTVAVLLDNRTAGAVDPAEVSALVSRAVGLDPTRGDQITVSSMPFDNSAAEDARKELEQARKAEAEAKTMTMLRNGGFVAGGLLILFIAWLKARKRRKAIRNAEIDLEELESLRRTVALQLAEADEEKRALANRSAMMAELESSKPAQDDGERLQISNMRNEIAEMVEQQPDDVAQLLRSWLADRRS